MNLRLLILLLCACLTLINCDSNKKNVIVFGFIPSSNIEEVELLSDSLCMLISQTTGLKVKSFVASDYESLIEAFRIGHVQMAWFAPMSYIEANEVSELTPLLTSVRSGKPFFYSAIFVRSDSKIYSVEDLKGKIMGFSDPTSTAGRIYPEAEIRKMGYNPESFFKQIIYLGGHDKVVDAVLNGTVDAGASFANDTLNIDNAWHQLLKNKQDASKFRPIHYTKPIPGDVIACLTSLEKQSPEKVKLITDELLKLSTQPDGQRLIKALNRTDSLLPVNIEDYNVLREVAKLVLQN